MPTTNFGDYAAAPNGAMPGTTANSAASSFDANSLSDTYQMTRADLAVPITFEGVRMTIGKAISLFTAFPANQILSWEKALVSAGLQSASTIGHPQSRADAFNALLRFASFNKTDVQTTLDQLQAENPTAPVGSTAGAKIHTTLANPADVLYLGNTVANKLVGRDLTAQEAQDITNSIRAQEMSSAGGELSTEQSLLAAQTGQGGGKGGVIATEAPTSPEAATQQYLTAHQGPDVQAHSLLNVFEAIKSKVETDAQGSGPRAASGPTRVI